MAWALNAGTENAKEPPERLYAICNMEPKRDKDQEEPKNQSAGTTLRPKSGSGSESAATAVEPPESKR